MSAYKCKQAYLLRKEGLEDWQIADELGVFEKQVPVLIGRYLMTMCRTEPKCPYKALLPEWKGNAEK